ncbi:MAG: sce7726 family protein [Flavobacteriales bacterium]|nr:sce7726 family protein [Flavobacteriales bacterium]
MRDRDIRTVLRDQLQKEYGHDSDTRILDELGVCQGSVRIDMAVVNGSLNGYEIKSERDTLERLPQQSVYYSKVFDHVTVVVGPSYFPSVKDVVPTWWGVVVAKPTEGGGPELVQKRKPKKNPSLDPYSIAQLLWREEALEVLHERGLSQGLLSKTRKQIWQTLADYLRLDELRDTVRAKLVSREGWRSDASPEQGDVTFRPSARP